DSLNAELNSQDPHIQWTVNEENINIEIAQRTKGVIQELGRNRMSIESRGPEQEIEARGFKIRTRIVKDAEALRT
ncbi:hypothetical protein ACOME3_010737, partial [Neoechinorhynchus agilis]